MRASRIWDARGRGERGMTWDGLVYLGIMGIYSTFMHVFLLFLLSLGC